jgi:two-component system chemotaxis response regulator CheB
MARRGCRIKRCGGVAVVQDPKDAEMPSMPLSALRHVKVDHQAPLAQLGELLVRLVSAGKLAAATAVPAPGRYAQETETLLGKGNFMELLEAVSMPSTFVCPECDGALWEITNSRPPNFRCHTGHAFSLRSLQHTQAEATDEALWSALRALQEKELLLKSLAELQRESSDRAEADRLQREAEQPARHAATLRELIARVPAPSE